MLTKLRRAVIRICRRLWINAEISGALSMHEATAYRAIVTEESRRAHGG